MRRLFLHISLFLLPVAIMLVFLPMDRRAQYTGLQDDCYDHGIWIHDRIHLHEAPIDVAFVGSSHTINAVDDQLLSDSLEMEVVNLGYCRLGRNLDRLIVEQVMGAKSPKRVVVEVREAEDRFSHPIYPYVASTGDVLTAYPFFCKDVVPDAWTHMLYKAELIQEDLYDSRVDKPEDRTKYGHGTIPDTASLELLEEKIKEKNAKRKELSSLAYSYQNQFPHHHLKQLVESCEAKGVEVVFLYLPSFDREVRPPSGADFYTELGEVLIPPSEIITDENLWHDENHLNEAGAQRLSIWLSKVLRR